MTQNASKGTKIYLDIASTLTEIPQVSQLSTSGNDVGVADVTDLNQAVAGMAYIPNGYAEGGSVSWDTFFDPVGVVLQALTDLITTPALKAWKIVWPDTAATVWTFSAIYKGINVTASKPDALVASHEAKLSGLFAYPT
jgi:hypothetical protein